MLGQRTLRNTIRATGVGLHTGKKVMMTLKPAPAEQGICSGASICPSRSIFRRARENVGETTLGTTLVAGEARISTVEHLLSAFAGLGIDNACVELTAAEVPIMDGSAGPFVFLLQSAGIEEQNAPSASSASRSRSRCGTETSGRALIRLKASRSTSRSSSITRSSSGVCSARSMDFSTTSFLKEISRARTFGFMRDLETLRAHNLALGGTLTMPSCWTMSGS